MVLTVYVNGVARPLLHDLRFSMLESFSLEFALYDMHTVPPTLIEVHQDGSDAGVTKRKLLPNGNYSVFYRGPNSELYPLYHPVCLFVLRLPPRCTRQMLWKLFSKFGEVKDADVFLTSDSESDGKPYCNGRGFVTFFDSSCLQLVPKVLSFAPDFPLYDIVVEVGYQLPDQTETEPPSDEGKLLFSAEKNITEVVPSSTYTLVDGYSTMHYLQKAPKTTMSSRGEGSYFSDISGMGGGRTAAGTPLLHSSSSSSNSQVVSSVPMSAPLRGDLYPSSSSVSSSPYGGGAPLHHSSPSRSPHLFPLGGISHQAPTPISYYGLQSPSTAPKPKMPRQKKAQKKNLIPGESDAFSTASPFLMMASSSRAGNYSSMSHGHPRVTSGSEEMGNADGHMNPHGGVGVFPDGGGSPFFHSISSPQSFVGNSDSTFMTSISPHGGEMSEMEFGATPKGQWRGPRYFVVHFSNEKEAQTAVAQQCFPPSISSEIFLLSPTLGSNVNDSASRTTSSNANDSGTNSISNTKSTQLTNTGAVFIVFTIQKGMALYGMASFRCFNRVTSTNSSSRVLVEANDSEKGTEVCCVQWMLHSVYAPIQKAANEGLSEITSLPSGAELTSFLGEKACEYLRQYARMRNHSGPSSFSPGSYSSPQVDSSGEYTRGERFLTPGTDSGGAVHHNRNKFSPINNSNELSGQRRKRFSPRGRGFKSGRGGGGVNSKDKKNIVFYSGGEEGLERNPVEEAGNSSFPTLGSLRPIGEVRWPPKTMR